MTTSHDDNQARRNQAVLEALAARQNMPAPEQPWPGAPAGEAAGAAPAAGIQVPWSGDPQTGERPGGLSLAAWVLIDAALAFALTIVFTLVATVAYAVAQGLGSQAELVDLIKDPYFFFLSIFLQSVAFVLVVIVRIMLLRKLPLSWLGVHNREFIKSLGWGALAGFAFLGVNIVMGGIFEALGSIPDQAEQFPTKGANGFQLALLGIAIAVFAPLVEELFFRGYALRAFTQRLGPRWGLILSAALFAGPHVLGITTGFIGLLVPIFFGGLILGYVYQRTGSLWSAIVAHAINNGAAFLVMLIAPQV
ncbi:MAG TPA: type II CAAX endopeptidase family protein [Herpetosiphonaceae bacterium]